MKNQCGFHANTVEFKCVPMIKKKTLSIQDVYIHAIFVLYLKVSIYFFPLHLCSLWLFIPSINVFVVLTVCFSRLCVFFYSLLGWLPNMCVDTLSGMFYWWGDFPLTVFIHTFTLFVVECVSMCEWVSDWVSLFDS